VIEVYPSRQLCQPSSEMLSTHFSLAALLIFPDSSFRRSMPSREEAVIAAAIRL
jgi:hypothetical protein